MSAIQHREWGSRRSLVCARRHRPASAVALWAVATLAPALAQTVPPPAAIGSAFTASTTSDADETAKGHGTVSVGYQHTYINGMFQPVPGGKIELGSIRVQSMSFNLDYFVADRWSVQLGIPFVESRYRGGFPHCVRTDPPQCRNAVVPLQPHPESKFLDDGKYHGTWQDWHIGLAHHANLNDYLLTPTISVQVPSHRYRSSRSRLRDRACGRSSWRWTSPTSST